jgi:hypothetical protein
MRDLLKNITVGILFGICLIIALVLFVVMVKYVGIYLLAVAIVVFLCVVIHNLGRDLRNDFGIWRDKKE